MEQINNETRTTASDTAVPPPAETPPLRPRRVTKAANASDDEQLLITQSPNFRAMTGGAGGATLSSSNSAAAPSSAMDVDRYAEYVLSDEDMVDFNDYEEEEELEGAYEQEVEGVVVVAKQQQQQPSSSSSAVARGSGGLTSPFANKRIIAGISWPVGGGSAGQQGRLHKSSSSRSRGKQKKGDASSRRAAASTDDDGDADDEGGTATPFITRRFRSASADDADDVLAAAAAAAAAAEGGDNATTPAASTDADKPWRQRLRHSSSLPQRLTGGVTRSSSAGHHQRQQHQHPPHGSSNSHHQQQQQQQEPPSSSNAAAATTTSSNAAAAAGGANTSSKDGGSGAPPRVLRYIRSLATGATRGKSSADRAERRSGSSNSGGGPAIEVAALRDDAVDDDHSQSSRESSLGSSSSHGSSSPSTDDEAETEEDNAGLNDSWDEDFLIDESEGEEWVGKERAVEWNRMTALPNQFCGSSEELPTTPVMTSSRRNLFGNSNTGVTGSALSSNQNNTVIHSPYLDKSMSQAPLTQLEGNRFVWEHALLLQAVLQLLVEREQVGVEGSVDVSDNIWKKGPLKKMSFVVGGRRIKKRPNFTPGGTWKVKYCELRRGNLCYYEDSLGPSSGRKKIHLRQADTIVQESSHYRGAPGFCFELLIQGSPARYWTARSEEERQSWIRAIQAAMIGQENTRYRELDLTPHQPSLQVYTKLRASIQEASEQEIYLQALQTAVQEIDSMQVPVEWVRREQAKRASTAAAAAAETGTPASRAAAAAAATITHPRGSIVRVNSAHHKRLNNSISEFWKSMRQATFSINGFVVPQNSPMAAERVVGSLTRCFLEYDKAYLSAAAEEAADDDSAAAGAAGAALVHAITELQAVSYARSILLAVLRGKEQYDLQAVVEDLLSGRPDLVGVVAMTDDPLETLTRLEVSFAGEEDLPDDFDAEHDSEDMASWIWLARRKSTSSSVPSSSKQWKRRYTILSGAVLSFYEAASPRPHGLRGQVVLRPDTTLTTKEVEPSSASRGDGGGTSDNLNSSNAVDSNDRGRYLVCLNMQGNEQEHLLCFKQESDMWAWKDALQAAIESSSEAVLEQGKTAPAKMLVKGAERVIKGAADGSIRAGIRVIRGAKDSGIKAMKITTDGSMKVIRGAVGRTLRITSSLGGGSRSANAARDSPVKNGRTLLKRAPSVQVLLDQSTVPGKREPSVQCVVQRSCVFEIRAATNPQQQQETEQHDSMADMPWASVQATWYQAFLMSGGPSGRINCGDALVELDFGDAKTEDEDEEEYVGEIDVL